MCQEQKKQIYMWPSHWEKPAAHGDYGAVSCNNSYAARAGLWILKNGGNAFDAAAAVSLALSVVEPHHSGIGGGEAGFFSGMLQELSTQCRANKGGEVC